MTPRTALRLVVACIALLPAGSLPRADAQETLKLTILHTNDTHGHLLPFSYPETFDPWSDLARLSRRRDIGGIARRATIARQLRSDASRHVLLVDAGDICDGTPFSTEFRGDADVAAMNAAGYDVACPGNHEFNNTVAQVRKLASAARFAYVCANVTAPSGTQPVYAPYVIRQVGTARVAFFGLLTRDAATYPAGREGLGVAEPIATARAVVPELRKQADFVVAVTHIGTDQDRILATSVDGIDAIIGGHSHTMLPAPLFIPQVPTHVPHSVNGTVIASNFEWGATLGRLDLTLYRSSGGTWTVKQYAGRPIPVTSSVKPDPAVTQVVDSYWSRISGTYGQVLGSATADFTDRGSDQAHYSLVADAVREATAAEFALENQGGVRAPVVKGPITYGDMVTVDPFSNTLVTFKVTGRNLKEALLRFHPAPSGLVYTVEAGVLTRAEVGGTAIADDRVYQGVTNSYFAGVLGELITDATNTGKSRLETVIAHIKARKDVSPAYDGRRIIR